MLLLKEFDEDRGEHFGVNHMGLTCERVVAGVRQDFGKRISAMLYPGVARTPICHQHRHGHLDPAISWERFALHEIADKSRVVGNGMCHASHARPRCLILLYATDVFGRNAHGLRQKVFNSFVALTLGRERRQVLRILPCSLVTTSSQRLTAIERNGTVPSLWLRQIRSTKGESDGLSSSMKIMSLLPFPG